MGQYFKNALVKNIGTAVTSVYTCPANTSATIIGLSLANTTTSSVIASIQVESPTFATTVYMVKGFTLDVATAAVPIGGEQKLVLVAGDIVKVTSSVTNSVDVILSVLEIS